MASFCCSIETEPKTLSQGQLSHAKEVAVDIVQKRESIEASEIFFEGMVPIIGIKEMARTVEMRDSICNHVAENKDATIVNQTVCQCSLVTSAILDTPDQARPKEPLSAPF